jgi:hypothetical protein
MRRHQRGRIRLFVPLDANDLGVNPTDEAACGPLMVRCRLPRLAHLSAIPPPGVLRDPLIDQRRVGHSPWQLRHPGRNRSHWESFGRRLTGEMLWRCSGWPCKGMSAGPVAPIRNAATRHPRSSPAHRRSFETVSSPFACPSLSRRSDRQTRRRTDRSKSRRPDPLWLAGSRNPQVLFGSAREPRGADQQASEEDRRGAEEDPSRHSVLNERLDRFADESDATDSSGEAA